MVANKVRKYLAIIKTNTQGGMVYTFNLLFESAFFALIIFIFLQLWGTVSKTRGDIDGYSVNKLIWYYIIAEFVILTRSNVFVNLNDEIKGGNIAYKLNKPYDYILYQLSEGIGQVAIKVAINISVGILIGFLFVGKLEGFNIIHIPAIILSILLGMSLYFFIEMCIGMTAFFSEDNAAFFWIFQKFAFIFGLLLPLEFLPETLRKVAIYLPFPYIAYAPARLTSTFSLEAFKGLIFGQLIYLVVFIVLSYWLFAKGVKKLNVNGG